MSTTGSCHCGKTASRKDAEIPAELARWSLSLELVDLTLGQVISEPGADLAYACFALDAIVSLLYVMNDGGSAEIALVGNDGMLGVTLFMGGNSTTIRAVVQSAGKGLPAAGQRTGRRGGPWRRDASGHAAVHAGAVDPDDADRRLQPASPLNQQFSRWLLLSLDRLCGTEMVMTQKLIAKMLGVPSDEVIAAATALGAAGAIACRDGRISLRDRSVLEKTSCEGYQFVKRECDRLLPPAQRSNG